MPGESPDVLTHKKRLMFAILVATAALILTSLKGSFNTWTSTHWLFTFEFGFIKRGLIGTLVSTGIGDVSKTTLWAIQLSVAALTSLTIAVLIWAVTSKSLEFMKESNAVRIEITALISACFLLSSPGVIQQWFYDLGRFDAFGFLILCISYVLTNRSSIAIGLIGATALSATAILIHEAFFFWITPMCLGLWLWKHWATTRELVWAALIALALTGLTGIVGVSSYSEFFDFDTAKAILQDHTDFPVNDNSLMVHYRDFSSNLEYTFERSWGLRRLAGIALGVIFLGSHLIFVFWLFSQKRLDIDPRKWFLALAAFAPLTLLILGHDQGRWFAMINCNLILLFLAIADEAQDRIVQFTRLQIIVLTIGILANIALGPFGVTVLFPHLVLWEFFAQLN